jgi:hypothetical protein
MPVRNRFAYHLLQIEAASFWLRREHVVVLKEGDAMPSRNLLYHIGRRVDPIHTLWRCRLASWRAACRRPARLGTTRF